MSINVLIADDHSIVREGLKKVINEEPDFRVVAEASDADEVLGLLKKHHTDILLLDISMPRVSGIDIIKDVKSHFPYTKILVLSIHPEEQYAVPVLKLGASGYLNKSAIPDELISALRTIYRGSHYINSALTEILARSLRFKKFTLPHESLSGREFEVFRLLASGKTVSQIADVLSLNIATVSTYRTRILHKMNMKNTAQLIHYALTNKIVI